MATTVETSDGQLLNLLRRGSGASVSELASATGVTLTAVRQRLTRLMGQGLVSRETSRVGRGRPSHRYSLTALARRRAGTNYSDLAAVLWQEVRAIQDPTVRRGLLQRLAHGMAKFYEDQVQGESTAERMESLAELLANRQLPFEVRKDGGLPVLVAHDCPYPGLAEQDRGVCAMEKLVFSELLSTNVRLSQCRLDGQTCCQFETN